MSHLNETQTYANRLEIIFTRLEVEPGGHKCVAMEGPIKEGEELITTNNTAHLLDAALVAAAQRIDHYEIAGYGTARPYEEKFSRYSAAEMLQQTLDEEGNVKRAQTRLAERNLNFLAMGVDETS